MIYYKNTGADEADSITIIPTKPPEEEAILLVSEFEFLQNFDFKEFNYFNFEQDITDMSKGEFEWWFDSVFRDWLYYVDENYIDIDFNEISSEFTSQEEKRIFLLKIVNFIMFLLPYQILKKVFSKLNIESIEEFQNFISSDINLINLRNLIIEEIDSTMISFDDFIQTLRHFEKVAKKNLVEENIQLLDDHVKKQNFFFEIFKELIKNTDMHKFKNYLNKLFENDWRNVL